MNISHKDILRMAFGYMRYTISADGIDFYRMSERQSELFRAADRDGVNNFLKKSFATAGIRLDFFTRSKTFSFSYCNAVCASSRNWYYFDVLVNGERKGSIGEESAARREGSFSMALDGEYNRVTVFFPNLFRVTLSSLSLSDGFTPFVPARRILVYGDSISQGYDAKRAAQAYVNAYALRTDAEVFNLAVGGSTADPVLLDDDFRYDADAIFVAYGTNDWRHKSRQAFFSDFRAFFSLLTAHYPQTPVYVLLPVVRLDQDLITQVGSFGEARHAIAQLAQEHPNVTVIDTLGFLPAREEMFSDRYLHPNEEGFDRYTQGLLAATKTMWEAT